MNRNEEQTNKTVVAEFATSLRASSAIDALVAANINAEMVSPKWTNKRLPPPKHQVVVSSENAVAAKERLIRKDW